MSRDYKKPVRTTTENNKGNPLITGVIIGILIGLLLAAGTALLFTDLLKPFSKRKEAAAAEQAADPAAAKTAAAPKPTAPEKTTFDFYTILPAGNKAVTAPSAGTASAPAPAADAPAAAPTLYLQAGSFPNVADADNLKANLAMLGLEAAIQTTQVNGQTWHRVRLGPYADPVKLNQDRTLLQQNGINASVVKAAASPAPGDAGQAGAPAGDSN